MKTNRIISVLAFIAIAFFTQAQQYYQSNSLPEIRISNYRPCYNNSYQMPTVCYSAPSVRYQNTYQRYDGTVVEGYYKTQSNNTNWDNFSTSGNVNPYTGQSGTRARDYSSEALNYGKGQVIQTGSRGGQYYINSNGNKTYVPKR
jgi:hypothetical protein